MKTEGSLQEKSVKWARYHLVNSVAGLVAISATTPLMSERIFDKWFSFPEAFYLAPIPVLTAVLIFWLYGVLKKMPMPDDRLSWLPFVLTMAVFILSFIGLAYSFFPYIVPERMTIIEAAAAPESLIIMLVGALIVLPVLIGYTALAYYVFRGKATELRYD